MAADCYIDTLQDKYITPLVASSVKAINKGWNCFQYKLAYDPNISSKNAHFNVGYYDALLSKLSLTSEVNLSSSGTIVGTSSSNPLSAVISLIGKTAGNKVDSLLSKYSKSKSTLYSLLKNGASSLVSSGATYLLKNFLSSFNKSTPTTYTLQINTTGTITTKGVITSNCSSNVVSVNNLLVPGGVTENSDNLQPIYNKPLGVWNLATTPIIEIKKDIDYWDDEEDNPRKNSKEITYRVNKYFLLRPSSVHIIFNPAISSEIDSSKVIVRLTTNGDVTEEKDGLQWKGLFYNSTISNYGNLIVEPYSGAVKFKVTTDTKDIPMS